MELSVFIPVSVSNSIIKKESTVKPTSILPPQVRLLQRQFSGKLRMSCYRQSSPFLLPFSQELPLITGMYMAVGYYWEWPCRQRHPVKEVMLDRCRKSWSAPSRNLAFFATVNAHKGRYKAHVQVYGQRLPNYRTFQSSSRSQIWVREQANQSIGMLRLPRTFLNQKWGEILRLLGRYPWLGSSVDYQRGNTRGRLLTTRHSFMNGSMGLIKIRGLPRHLPRPVLLGWLCLLSDHPIRNVWICQDTYQFLWTEPTFRT